MRAGAACLSVAATLAVVASADAAATFRISGGGYGHGIGMSQYGAYGYALHGKDYEFILAHYYQGTQLGNTNPNQDVTVLLATGSASFSAATRAANKKLNPSFTYSVKALANGSLVLFDQTGKKVGKFTAPLTVTGPGPLDLVGHGLYRGSLEFRPSGGGVETVNAVDLEDYVRGVVSAEMPSSWAPQALEAQAVAARTYAITTGVDGDGFELYPDTRSQMYEGVAAETPSTDAAVDATRGQVVTYNGVPAVTYFFSSSGGYTESIQNVWLGSNPEPWLHGVPDPYDDAADNPYHRWSYEMTIAAGSAKLGSLLQGKLVGIKVTEHGVSPRVVTASVVGSKGTTTVTGPQLQSIFSLPSTYMSFTTISSTPGMPTAQRRLSRALLAAANTALGVLAVAPPALHGSVFPAAKHAVVAIQLRTRKGWRTVRHVRLGKRGRYSVKLRVAGSYRVSDHGVLGPAVRVS